MLTCSSKLGEDSSDSLVWLIDGGVAGEGSEDMIDDGRIVSNWWFVPQKVWLSVERARRELLW